MKKIIFFLLIIFSKPGYCLDLNSIKALLALSLCVEESNITEIHSSQINPGEWEQLVSVLERVVSGGGAVLEANSTRFHRLDFRVVWNNNRYRFRCIYEDRGYNSSNITNCSYGGGAPPRNYSEEEMAGIFRCGSSDAIAVLFRQDASIMLTAPFDTDQGKRLKMMI